MLDGGLRTDFRGSRRPWHLLVVLAVALVPPAVYHAGAARAGVEVVGRGYVVEPAGHVVSGSDGPVLAYPDDRVTPVRLTVPVRNTSRVTVTVGYPRDLAYPAARPATQWPAQAAVVTPGQVAWLSIPYAAGCPTATVAAGRGTRTIDRIRLTLSSDGADERAVTVPLPVPVRVPVVDVPFSCLPVPEPGPEPESPP